jgi:hypothetical protein
MSAAATAAGYLYASGRLRGRSKDGEEPERNRDGLNGREALKGREAWKDRESSAPPKRRLRIAAIPEQPILQEAAPAPRARPAPKIEYRVRRWRPE